MKKLVEWNNELSVGVQEIDEQHKVLINLLNKLYEAIITVHDQELIESILDELAQYTVIHFAVEESLMRIFNYPGYEEHRKHHAELTKQVLELQAKVKSGKAQVSIEVLNFLRHWLTHHIMGDDQKYGPYLIDHGVKATWSERSWIGRIWGTVHH